MPQTALYVHTNSGQEITGLGEAYKLILKKYPTGDIPSGPPQDDDKTLEQASSTLISAAISPEWDGELLSLSIVYLKS